MPEAESNRLSVYILVLFSFPPQSFVQEENEKANGSNAKHHQKHNT